MSVQTIDPTLTEWGTQWTRTVAGGRDALVEKLGEEGYQKALVLAQRMDAKAQKEYGDFSVEVSRRFSQVGDAASSKPYLEAIAAASSGLTSGTAKKRVQAESEDLIQAAQAWTALRRSFGLSYGDPDTAAKEFSARPDSVRGAAAEAARYLGDFGAFWEDLRPQIEQSRRQQPDSPEDARIGTIAANQTGLGMALRMMSEDRLVRPDLTVGFALDERAPGNYAVDQFLKSHPDVQVDEQQKAALGEYLQSSHRYLSLAAGMEKAAGQDAKEGKAPTYRTALEGYQGLLDRSHGRLQALYEALPEGVRGQVPQPPPKPSEAPQGLSGYAQSFLRGLFYESAKPILDRFMPGTPEERLREEAGVALRFPRAEPKESLGERGASVSPLAGPVSRVGDFVLGLIPGNPHTAVEDLAKIVPFVAAERAAAPVGAAQAAGVRLLGGADRAQRIANVAGRIGGASGIVSGGDPAAVVAGEVLGGGGAAIGQAIGASRSAEAMQWARRRAANRPIEPAASAAATKVTPKEVAAPAPVAAEAAPSPVVAPSAPAPSPKPTPATPPKPAPKPPAVADVPEGYAKTPAGFLNSPSGRYRIHEIPESGQWAITDIEALRSGSPKRPTLVSSREAAVDAVAALEKKAGAVGPAQGGDVASPVEARPAAPATTKSPAVPAKVGSGPIGPPMRPDPIQTSGPVENTRALSASVNKALGAAIKVAKQERGVRGHYRFGTGAIQVASPTDIPLKMHEAGHRLDRIFQISHSGPLNKLKADPDILAELQGIPEFSRTIPRGAPPAIEAMERFSEFFAGWTLNPKEASRLAPKTAAALNKIPNLAEWESISERVRRIEGADPLLRPAATIVRPSEVGAAAAAEGIPRTPASKMTEAVESVFEPIRAAQKFRESTTGTTLRASERPSARLKVVLGHPDTMEAAFEMGLPKRSIGKVHEYGGQPLSGKLVYEPVAKLVKAHGRSEKEWVQVIDSVLQSEREIPLSARMGRETTGTGLGIRSGSSVSARSLAALRGLPAEQRDLVLEATKRYRALMDATLDNLVSSGRMHASVRQQIQRAGIPYASFQRLMEVAPDEPLTLGFFAKGRRALSRPDTPIKRIKGSEREIVSPYMSAWQVADRVQREIARNDLIGATVKLMKGIRGQEFRELRRIGEELAEKETGSVTWFDRGVEKHYRLDPSIKKSLDMAEEIGSDLPRFLTGWKNLVQRMVTADPAFRFVRNYVRGVRSVWVKSQAPGALGGLIPDKPLAGVVGIPKNYRAEAELGGLRGFGFFRRGVTEWEERSREEIAKMVRAGDVVLNPKSLAMRGVDGFRHWYDRVGRAAEMRPLLGEYYRLRLRAKKLGMSDYDGHFYALEKSRDLQDFAERGQAMKYPAAVSPFLNAAIRSIAGLRMAVRDDPRVLARGLAVGAASAAIEYAAAEALGVPDKLRRLNDLRRDLFLNIPLPDGRWMTLPISYEEIAFKAVARRLADYLQTGDDSVWKGLPDAVAKSFSPVDNIGQLLGPATLPVELATNREFFSDREIIPEYERKLAPEKRKGREKASEAGKVLDATLGQITKRLPILGVTIDDPRQWDHILESMGAGFGRRITQATAGRPVEGLGLVREEPSSTRAIDSAFTLLERSGKRSKELYEAMKKIREAKDRDERDEAIADADKIARSIIGKEGW